MQMPTLYNELRRWGVHAPVLARKRRTGNSTFIERFQADPANGLTVSGT